MRFIASGLPLLLAGRVISGLSAGIFTGTATATLIDLAPAGGRSRATLVATVANMGALGSGPLLGGLLSQWAGSPLRLTFWVDLALVVPGAIGIWAMPEPMTPAWDRWPSAWPPRRWRCSCSGGWSPDSAKD
jgi:MFS family permease